MSSVLLVYLSEDFSDADVSALQVFVKSLAGSRRWTLGVPNFVDESDSSTCTRHEDEPIRTVGAALAVTEPDEPRATSRAEATALIEAMAAFSKEYDVEMEVQLGNTYVGEIRAGVPDRLVWGRAAGRMVTTTRVAFDRPTNRPGHSGSHLAA